MESPTRGAKEERAHTAGAGLPAPGTPMAGEEAVPRSRGALAGGGAEESYLAITTPGGPGGEGPPLSGCATGHRQRDRRRGGKS